MGKVFAYLSILVATFTSCQPEMTLEGLMLKRNSWDEVLLVPTYQNTAWHSLFSSKNLKPTWTSIAIYRENGDLFKRFENSISLKLNDSSMGDTEKLSIKFSSTFNSNVISKDTFIFASPKKTNVVGTLDYPLPGNEDKNKFKYNIEVYLQRKTFNGINYENIKRLKPIGNLDVSIDQAGRLESFMVDKDSATIKFNNQTSKVIWKHLYAQDRINVKFNYLYDWDGISKDIAVDFPLFVDPKYSFLEDGANYSLKLIPHQASYVKMFVPKNKIFVFVFNGDGNEDDLDVYKYDSKNLEEIKLQADETGNKEILYYVGSGNVDYIKMHNPTDHFIKGTFHSYTIKYEEVIAQAAIDYSMQYIAKEIINVILGIEDKDKAANNLSDTAANMIVSSINGSDHRGMTKNAVINQTVNTIRSTFGHGEMVNFIIACVVNLYNAIYFYY